MPLCRVNVEGEELATPSGAERDLRAALAAIGPAAPVVVLIHGYRFSPACDQASPHTHILSPGPERGCWKALSWPRELGLGSGGPDEPLCIALGWEARGSVWQAYANAALTGRALADLIMLIRRLRPDRPVDILAHSFGGRVALSALPHLPAGAMGRAVLLAPAELRSRALVCLDTIAGRTVEILNVTSRQNGPYDRALEWLIAPLRLGERALGAGLAQVADNWTDVNIDQRTTRETLARHGFELAAAERRICHWSVYLRPGLFPVYRAVLSRTIPLAALRSAPEPTASARSRLSQLLVRPLPFAS